VTPRTRVRDFGEFSERRGEFCAPKPRVRGVSRDTSGRDLKFGATAGEVKNTGGLDELDDNSRFGTLAVKSRAESRTC